MSNKKGKMRIRLDGAFIMRSIDMSQPEYAVIATENPVRRYDEETKEIVQEVLLMDGVEFRGGRDHVPIVDTHNNKSVHNVFGSIQRMRIEDGRLVGIPSWSSDAEAQKIATRVNEGHLTDFSIDARPIETLYITRSQSYTTPRGAVIQGPALIRKRWEPHNASICTTGADVDSVIRRSYTDLNRSESMDEALLAQLKERGLPDGMTDPNQVLAWVVGALGGSAPATSEPPAAESVEHAEPSSPSTEEDPEKKEPEMAAQPSQEENILREVKDIEDTVQRSLTAERTRVKEIRAACTLAKLDRGFADGLCDEGVDINVARDRIIRKVAENSPQPSGVRIRATESEDDKFYDAARDGLIQRCFSGADIKRSAFEGGKAADGSDDFKRTKISRLAESFVKRMGVNVDRLEAPDIAKIALGNPATLERFRIQRDAQHTTGSFRHLLLDASHKVLLAGYEEAPYTWNMWARQAPSVDDFKPINRIRFSELATPEHVPEGTEYPDAKASDSKESYKIEKHGSMFSITWETVVNDDLDAISRIPAMQGAACRRKQNMMVYAILTANANLADGGALFNSNAQFNADGSVNTGGHANLAGSTGAPNVTTLNAGFLSMMTKKGMLANVILNIQPSFLIVPAALSATALQLLGSIADPAAGGSAAGNSNTKNIYGPNGDRPLKVIVEPQLDAASTSAWYLAASNSQCDTVELAFLAGEESPVLEQEWDFKRDVYYYKVRQTFGVAAVEYRGLYKNAG